MRAHRTMSIHAVAGVLFGATALGVPALPGLGELVGPSFAFAQDTTRIASPVLLKRLAEAVDGHRGHSRVAHSTA